MGLKGHTKGLIDIQSKEIWFEAKHNGRESSYAMFTQLLHYVQAAFNKVNQKVTRVARPQTNGKAERVVRTLMQMWHQQIMFRDAHHRQVELVRFINFCNTVKPRKGLNNATPYEILMTYFNQALFKH